MSKVSDISPRSMELFLAYAAYAGQWGGTLLAGGVYSEVRGNLTQLEQAGLITTSSDEPGSAWICLTEAGRDLATEHGIELPIV